ncbi:MAG: PKD domain-containing protein, partial [Gammaproteobacteria bacterium]|nr:PKD domain-containing protein [Gammaproteobacteria bacterium]
TSPITGNVYPENSDISFTGTGEDDEDSTLSGASLAWSSDIDGPFDNTGETVSFALSAGSHTITLEATDSIGATGSDTVTVTVNAAPVIDTMLADPTRVNVGASTAINWSITDAEGDMLTCDLDINADGTNDHTIDDCANNTSQIHTYMQTGDYQIRLTVADSVNASVEQTVNVSVMDFGAAPEVVSFSATPEAPKTGSSVTFDWDVSDADGDTLTCKLDVDADGTDDYTVNDCASNTSQAHTYTQAGVYQARLTVEDGLNFPVQTFELTVSSTSPVISQFIADPAYSTVATTFYWQVSDPDGDMLTCTLDIDSDGMDDYIIDDCANIASQGHTYTTAGERTAQLTVRDSVNEIQDTLPLVVRPPLLLDVSVNGPVSASGKALYTMTVSNVSAQPVDDVSVVYTVPAELQFDAENDAEPNATGCETACTEGLDATWVLGTLADGESRTITVNASVLPGVSAGAGIVVPVRSVSSSIADIINVSRMVAVDNEPEVQLVISASKDPLMPGDSLTLTLDIGNIDNAALDNLELRAILPTDVTVDSISNGGTEDAATGNIIWDISSLAMGSTLRRTIDVTVSATAIAGQIIATRAELRYDEEVDPDASAEQAVTVAGAAFPIVFDISTASELVEAGERLRYDLTISNVSDMSVDDVSVLLRVPPELQFDAANDAEPDATGCGAVCTDSQEAFWVLGTLDSGENRIITVGALTDASLSSGRLITVPVRVTATDSGDDIDRLKTVAVVAVVGNLALAQRSGCLVCHSIDGTPFDLAPAWNDVADRYRDDSSARAMLIDKVKNGGSGNWGSIPMISNSPGVSDANIEALVDFILSL